MDRSPTENMVSVHLDSTCYDAALCMTAVCCYKYDSSARVKRQVGIGTGAAAAAID